jgi:ParB family chromosome partitioning protein
VAKKATKRGLGKGMDALMPIAEEDVMPERLEKAAIAPEELAALMDGMGAEPSGTGEFFIEIDKLRANPNQPRKHFDEAELAGLADSIRGNGVIQPIIVEKAEEGLYTIVSGERRYRAARMAGLEEMPAVVRSYTEEKRLVVALIENLQRKDLDPIEEAAGYRDLMERTGLNQEEAAQAVGKNRSTIANALRLLKLPFTMQASLQTGEISPGHARAILSLSDSDAQIILYREILAKELSVREAEKRAAALQSSAKKAVKAKKPQAKRDPELVSMEEKFISRLGTKVVLQGGLDHGTIAIDYYSMEDLDRLYGLINGS